MCTGSLLPPIFDLHDPAVTAVDDRVKIALFEVTNIALNCIFCDLKIRGEQDNDMPEVFGSFGEVSIVPLQDQTLFLFKIYVN